MFTYFYVEISYFFKEENKQNTKRRRIWTFLLNIINSTAHKTSCLCFIKISLTECHTRKTKRSKS